jgi:hypothetical protein
MAQEGAKKLETDYIVLGLKSETQPHRSPIDNIKNGCYNSVKSHKNGKGKNIGMAGIAGVLENMQRLTYHTHILSYDHIDGKKFVTGLQVLDLSKLYELWVSPECLEEIEELNECVKSHNGRNGVPLLPEDENIYSERIAYINGLILAKSGLSEKVFNLRPSFDRKRRVFRIQCYLHSVERFLKYYPERLIYRGFESEEGFDVRQLVVEAKERKTSRSRN